MKLSIVISNSYWKCNQLPGISHFFPSSLYALDGTCYIQRNHLTSSICFSLSIAKSNKTADGSVSQMLNKPYAWFKHSYVPPKLTANNRIDFFQINNTIVQSTIWSNVTEECNEMEYNIPLGNLLIVIQTMLHIK